MKRASIATLGTGPMSTGLLGRSPGRRTSMSSVSFDDDEGPNDAVLMKCRDAIEKLQEELEEERNRRRELQRQVNNAEAETLQLQNEVDLERGKRADYESRTTRLEKQLEECESKLDTSGKWRQSANEELQKAKAEATSKAQEVFSHEFKIQELEHALHRANSRIASAEAEISNFNSEVLSQAERLHEEEGKTAELKVKLQEETDELETLQRHVKDRNHAIEVARREVEDAKRAVRRLEEEREELLMDFKNREEALLKQYKDTEEELKKNFEEKMAKTKAESVKLSKEVEVLKTRIPELESAADREKEAIDALKIELASSKAEGKKLQADQERMVQELNGQGIELAQLKAQRDVYTQQAQTVEREQRQAQERLFDLSNENSQLYHEVEEAKKLLKDRSEELQRQQENSANRQQQLELLAQQETRSLKEEAEREINKVNTEMAELRMQQKLDTARRNDLQEQQQRALEDKEVTQKHLSELTTKLDTAKSELKVEQEKTKDSATNVVQMRRALRQSEEEVDALQEQLALAQRELGLLNQQAEARVAAALAEKDQRQQELEKQMSRCAAKIKEVELSAEKSSQRSQSKQRKRYEQKLSKMHQQLAERETYEARLKSLIEDEVGAIHRWNSDLNAYDRRAASLGRTSPSKVALGDRRPSNIIRGLRYSDLWDDD